MLNSILTSRTCWKGSSFAQSDVDVCAQSFLKWSNAHIEAMILHLLGPSDCDEAAAMFGSITMSEDSVWEDRTAVPAAAEYHRKWEEMLRWCSRHLPHPKALVETFISNLQPRPLAAMLKKRYLKDIHECMTVFLSLFMEGLKSKKSGSIFVKPGGNVGGGFCPFDKKVGKELACVW